MGKNPQIEKAVVRWPSGRVQTIANPVVGQINKIKEPA
ncbi:MAG: ASPIC/UnbV domain-containing protein [Acidobacteriota bacterium]|nr:ASPIC/UnbV domain-containing protein [Acidobacteriota bacterium]